MCSSFPGLLIGRTAVHSGKDPAFVAYDQFLSTDILQPLSRGEVRCGSVSVIRRCPLNVRFARKRTRLGDLWARRYRVQTGGFALSLGELAPLAQNEELDMIPPSRCFAYSDERAR